MIPHLFQHNLVYSKDRIAVLIATAEAKGIPQAGWCFSDRLPGLHGNLYGSVRLLDADGNLVGEAGPKEDYVYPLEALQKGSVASITREPTETFCVLDMERERIVEGSVITSTGDYDALDGDIVMLLQGEAEVNGSPLPYRKAGIVDMNKTLTVNISTTDAVVVLFSIPEAIV